MEQSYNFSVITGHITKRGIQTYDQSNDKDAAAYFRIFRKDPSGLDACNVGMDVAVYGKELVKQLASLKPGNLVTLKGMMGEGKPIDAIRSDKNGQPVKGDKGEYVKDRIYRPQLRLGQFGGYGEIEVLSTSQSSRKPHCPIPNEMVSSQKPKASAKPKVSVKPKAEPVLDTGYEDIPF